MNILITGCAGSTGSVVAEKLIKIGHRVIGIDNLFNGKMSYLDSIMNHPSFIFIKGDILDDKLLAHLQEEKFQQIYHFAAVVETCYFYDAPLLTYETNVEGTKRLLDFAKKNGTESFLNASSSEVYGHQKLFPSTPHQQMVFDSPLESTRWSYAVGKLMGEYLARAYSSYFKTVSIRYANLYGHRDLESNHIVPYTIRTLREQKSSISLTMGSEERQRSFLHVDDCAEGTIELLNSGHSGLVYNLAGVEELTIKELVLLIASLFNRKIDIEYHGVRPGDPDRRLLDTTLTREHTEWRQKVPLKEGLKRVMEAFDQKELM